MSELEQLIQQRNEIQRKIQEIKKNGITRVGRIKIEKRPYGDRWYIAIYKDYEFLGENRNRWQPIISDKKKKEDAIKEIPKIIEDLQNLYDMEVKS